MKEEDFVDSSVLNKNLSNPDFYKKNKISSEFVNLKNNYISKNSNYFHRESENLEKYIENLDNKSITIF